MQTRCRNCGHLGTLPDYHGPTLVKCPQCAWQETYPARRHIATDLDKRAGEAYDARADRQRRVRPVFERLRGLTNRDFERFCVEMFESLGYEAVLTDQGLDQSHAIELRWDDTTTYVACHPYSDQHPVAREEIDNLVGSMRHDHVAKGIFVTTGTFADACTKPAREADVELIDGAALLERLESMDPDALSAWSDPTGGAGPQT